MTISQTLTAFLNSLAVFTWGNAVMVVVGLLIVIGGLYWKRGSFLVIPLGFGCLLVNLAFPYLGGLFSAINSAGLATGLLPILVLVGLGAALDLTPLLTRPRTILLSAIGQVGVFLVLLLAVVWKLGIGEAAAVGIASVASAASGPLAIFAVSRLAPHLLVPVALASIFFAAALPLARTVLMRLLVVKSEWTLEEGNPPSPPSSRAHLLLPVLVTIGVSIFFPGIAPLVGALMLGNLLRTSTYTSNQAASIEGTIYPVIQFFLGLTIGGAMLPSALLTGSTVKVLLLVAVGVILNALVWVLGVRYAGRWVGTRSQDLHSDLLASILAAGAILGVATLIP